MKNAVANIYSAIPQQLPDELLQTLYAKGPVQIERILSKGHASADDDWYAQIQDEWILLLDGRAELQFKNKTELIKLKPGDYLHIPAHTLHRVHWTAPDQETIWLAIHIFPNEIDHE